MKRLFFLAGELSGDLHGSALIGELKKVQPDLECVGIGGKKMEEVGLTPIFPFSSLQVMGFSDVLFALPRIVPLFYRIKNWILENQPDAVVTIDYPGLNLRLGKALRKAGYRGKLIHYISPTVWVWGKSRITTLANNYDLLLTILPFEPALYPRGEFKAEYVGHPLVSRIKKHVPDMEWWKECGLNPDIPLITLFPGSRRGEVERNLPIQLEAARPLLKECRAQIAISVASEEVREKIQSYAGNTPLISPKWTYACMENSHLALATSGTATLELALFQTPTVVTYRLSLFNYLIAKYLIRLKLQYYSLPNILLEKEVFPEFMQVKPSPHQIYQAALELFKETKLRARCLEGCKKIVDVLGERKASYEAAKSIGSLWNS